MNESTLLGIALTACFALAGFNIVRAVEERDSAWCIAHWLIAGWFLALPIRIVLKVAVP